MGQIVLNYEHVPEFSVPDPKSPVFWHTVIKLSLFVCKRERDFQAFRRLLNVP